MRLAVILAHRGSKIIPKQYSAIFGKHMIASDLEAVVNSVVFDPMFISSAHWDI